jgi:hypothetical protein
MELLLLAFLEMGDGEHAGYLTGAARGALGDPLEINGLVVDVQELLRIGSLAAGRRFRPVRPHPPGLFQNPGPPWLGLSSRAFLHHFFDFGTKPEIHGVGPAAFVPAEAHGDGIMRERQGGD